MDIPEKIGRYEILDELGRGAMGSVYRAKDPAMGRVVAVKTILPNVLAGEDGKEFRERFYREARAAGALAHPGIVPMFDVGEHEGLPYLVMEYVSGQTLAQSMRQGGLSTLDRVCEIGHQLAEALAYAHRNGVVHRDIKPANVLLTSREVYGVERAKITDFGVAKLTVGAMTTTGKMVGTPAFMPPEQFTGAPIDGRTDIFSVGVILYWMTTGEQPFAGETMTSVSYKVVHTDPIPPSKLNPSISSALEAVILKCLAKNPTDRYQTGDDLARALGALRSSVNATGLNQATPAMATGVSDATIEATPSLRPQATVHASVAAPAVSAPVAASAAVPVKARNNTTLVAAALVVLAIANGIAWFGLHRSSTAANSAPGSQTVTSPAPAAVAAVQPTAAAVSNAVADAPRRTSGKPSAAVAKALPAPPVVDAPGPPAPAPVSKAIAVAVDFNPKTLDAKQNTRLKLDMSKVPSALPFQVQMDGKLYFRGTAGNKAEFDMLFAPPGMHEVRITVGTGSNAKSSNIVSGDFVAKKRMSLKIELRPSPAGSTGALDPSTQVVATLKQDRLFF
ncbi:MAG TPA: serine/threonine-protein kinase [Terracidiphilus sp.]|nr:serine/threonine-protein kinase [Terracidiphilus sp.]